MCWPINNISNKFAQNIMSLSNSMRWLLCLSICLISLVAAYLAEPGRVLLRYQNDVFTSGEIWRLLTAHFVHLGWSHLLLNTTGLIALWHLFSRLFTASQWLFIILVSSIGISMAFLLFDPLLDWYVGLSGVLHAIYASSMSLLLINYFFVQKSQFLWEDKILLVFLIIKLVYEQFYGALPFSVEQTGGAVIVNAHLYGAIMGCICAVFLFQFSKPAQFSIKQ